MARHPLGWRRSLLAVALTAVTLAVAVGVAFAVHAVVAGNHESTAAGGGGGVRDRPLSLQAAKIVYDNAMRSRTDKNVDMFNSSTCQKFITEDTQLRGVETVGELLDAYAQAQKLVPVQFIENATVVSASSTGENTAGSIVVSATVTDNRVVPPSTGPKQITYPMSYEQGMWKLCPSTGPV